MQTALRKLCILLFGFLFIGNVYAGAEDALPVEIGYVELKPSFISNLKKGGPKYIRADIQLMTEYASLIPEIELHMPAIRHEILMLIAGEDGNKLKTREGKEELRTKALEAVRATLKANTKKTLVTDLFFTAYYVK